MLAAWNQSFQFPEVKIREGLGILIQLYVYRGSVRPVGFASVFWGIVALQCCGHLCCTMK